MKHPENKKFILMLKVVLLIIAAPIMLWLFATNALAAALVGNWVFLLGALFIFFSPYGKTVLSSHPPRYSWRHWLSLIMLVEVITGLFFFCLLRTELHYIPYSDLLTDPLSAYTIARPLLWSWGLHPWPLVALLTAGLGYAHYNHQQLPLLSSLLPTLKNTDLDLTVKRTLHILLNATTFIALALTISCGALQLADLYAQHLGIHTTYGMHVSMLIWIFILFSIMASAPWNRFIHFLCRSNISIGLFLLGFMLFLSLFMTFGNILSPFLNALMPLSTPLNLLTPAEWNILNWGWWLTALPLIVSAMTRVSRGRSMREIVGAISLLPLIVASCSYFSAFDLFSWLATKSSVGLDLFALTGPLLVIIYLSNKQDAAFFIVGFMPNTPDNNVAKPRHTLKFIKPLLQGIALLTFAYLGLGLITVSFLMATGIVPCALAYLIMCHKVSMNAHHVNLSLVRQHQS